jgi:hypothetical protein
MTLSDEPDDGADIRLSRWVTQPLLNAGMTVAELENLGIIRVAFEAIIKGGTGTVPDVLALASDQSPRVQAAWKVSLWRYLRVQSGEVTADTIPQPTLEEWLLEQIADDELSARSAAGHELGDQPLGPWDAERVLVECETKRQVIEDLVQAVKAAEGEDKRRLLQILRLLAVPYVERSGYREEWRP